MTDEFTEMQNLIRIQKETFERNMNYLIYKLQELKNIGSAIGEVSRYECLEAVQREFNTTIERMMAK